jgi:bifunctional DNase/RNase
VATSDFIQFRQFFGGVNSVFDFDGVTAIPSQSIVVALAAVNPIKDYERVLARHRRPNEALEHPSCFENEPVSTKCVHFPCLLSHLRPS